MKFKQPYFISPHAVKRFQERVAHLPASKVIIIVQAVLQGIPLIAGVQRFNHQSCYVYKARYRDKEYLIPVFQNGKEWPSVPTVLLPGMKIYGKRERRNVL